MRAETVEKYEKQRKRKRKNNRKNVSGTKKKAWVKINQSLLSTRNQSLMA